MEILINAANILYLFAYFVRDILWLRGLTIIAALCLVPYFYLQAEPLMTAICWNLFFAALNFCWVIRLIGERWGINWKKLCPAVWFRVKPLGSLSPRY